MTSPTDQRVGLHQTVVHLLGATADILHTRTYPPESPRDDVCRAEGALLALWALRDLAPLRIDLEPASSCWVPDHSAPHGWPGPHPDSVVSDWALRLGQDLDAVVRLFDGALRCTESWGDRAQGILVALNVVQDLAGAMPDSVDVAAQTLRAALELEEDTV